MTAKRAIRPLAHVDFRNGPTSLMFPSVLPRRPPYVEVAGFGDAGTAAALGGPMGDRSCRSPTGEEPIGICDQRANASTHRAGSFYAETLNGHGLSGGPEQRIG